MDCRLWVGEAETGHVRSSGPLIVKYCYSFTYSQYPCGFDLDFRWKFTFSQLTGSYFNSLSVMFIPEKTNTLMINKWYIVSSYKGLPLSLLKCTISVANVLVLHPYMYMYIQIHEDIDTCFPDAESCLVRSTGIADRFFSYLEGTTKASSCCWLHTSPAETLYSLHTTASFIAQPPSCYTFLMKPMISF